MLRASWPLKVASSAVEGQLQVKYYCHFSRRRHVFEKLKNSILNE